ncbi:MAG: hypothetical protein ACLR9T_12240 [Thomasclavelia sp.]|uniref:hypothetical protein n=1 Tax=Thomasclavelia sp. TaxID=3025757 RepID=UPI0039A0FF34
MVFGRGCFEMYHATGEEKYKVAANGVEDKWSAFDKYTGLHHDVDLCGFIVQLQITVLQEMNVL